MYYIKKEPNPSGAYAAPQSNAFDGCIALPEEMLPTFLQYNGFVTLTVNDDTVVKMTPNEEAWETWKHSRPPVPEPQPTEWEKLRADIDFLSVMTGVEL